MKFSQIRRRRINKELTVNQACEFLGITQSYLYKLEQGRQKPSATLMLKFSELYECRIDTIFKDFNIKTS